MTLLKVGNHKLTDPDGTQAMISKTHRGQAHFAGTGPQGKKCSGCIHWVIQGRRDRVFYKKRVCGKSSIAGVIPKAAIACKYFEQVKK